MTQVHTTDASLDADTSLTPHARLAVMAIAETLGVPVSEATELYRAIRLGLFWDQRRGLGYST